VHHKVPVELGGRDTLANLVLVCQNCHVLAHVLSRKRYRTRVLESDF
jgi:5-methylcytosine-specific restriction endonuclease McrA